MKLVQDKVNAMVFSSSSSRNSGIILSLKYMYLVILVIAEDVLLPLIPGIIIAERIGNSSMMYYHTKQTLKHTHRPFHECQMKGGIHVIFMVFIVWICMCKSISRLSSLGR